MPRPTRKGPARFIPLAAGTVLFTCAALHGSAHAQNTDFANVIFDMPCQDLIGTTAEDMAGRNTIIAAIFTGFIAGSMAETDARAMYDDLFSHSQGLGALCEGGDQSLYEAMSTTVADHLAAR